VAFLDDDNVWLPGHLRGLVEALDRGNRLAYSDVVRVRDDGVVFDRLEESFSRSELRHRNYIDISSVAVRRTGGIRFSRRPRKPKEMPGEDWVYLWRRSRRGGVAHVSQCTVQYLINPESYFWPGFSDFAKAAPAAASGTSTVGRKP
jgi:hypothetical protein